MISLPEPVLKGRLLAPLRARRDWLANLIQEEVSEEAWERLAPRVECVFRVDEDCVSAAAYVSRELGWQAQAWFREAVEITCEIACREAAQAGLTGDSFRVRSLQSFLLHRARHQEPEEDEDWI